ncbi:winged helix-turn-helix domain-containing protein [Salinicoccus albus]|uniref:winged helix-turn-helix domain-containing protein n=1 Tax=Salinicoccus albus TaxID=418756 RepID=UPI00037968ED
MAKKILIAEDDNDINQLLSKIIKKHGFTPRSVYSGTEATLYLEKEKWDLILLDLMLPGKSGENILLEAAGGIQTPVIIISAKDAQKTKVEMLRLGADDFITKPFDIEEVSARIESVLRRYERSGIKDPAEKLAFKDIIVDPEAMKVTVGGQALPLTAREYRIIDLLVRSPDKVFSKANIFESVWKEPFHGDVNTVNVHVSHLRTKLAEANPDETYIETVWGMGYSMKT